MVSVGLKKAINDYGNDTVMREQIDFVQSEVCIQMVLLGFFHHNN